MVWFKYFYLKHNYRKKYSFLRNEQNLRYFIRIRYSMPLSDSRKLVLGSLVKEIFETEYIP